MNTLGKKVLTLLMAVMIVGMYTFGDVAAIFAADGGTASIEKGTKTAEWESPSDQNNNIVKVQVPVTANDSTISTPVKTRIVLVLDRSGSMGYPLDNTTRVGKMQSSAKDFVNKVTSSAFASTDVQVGIVSFSYSATNDCSFTKDKSSLDNAISSIKADGGTNTQDGIKKAREMMAGQTADNKFIIVLSDGVPTYSYGYDDLHRTTQTEADKYNYGFDRVYDPIDYSKVYGHPGNYYDEYYGETTASEALIAKKAGYSMYSIGFATAGNDDANKVLESIANKGQHYSAGADLSDVFEKIAKSIQTQIPAGSAATVTDKLGFSTDTDNNYQYELYTDATHPVTLSMPGKTASSTTPDNQFNATNSNGVTSSCVYDSSAHKFTWVLSDSTVEKGDYLLTYYVKLNDAKGDIGSKVNETNTNDSAVLSYTNNSGSVVTSTYNKPSFPLTHITFTGSKTLSGRDMKAGEFKFTVKNSSGNVVATGTNEAAQAGGSAAIDFTSIPFTKAGIYKFTVTEDKSTLGGVTSDTKSYNVTVKVTNNKDDSNDKLVLNNNNASGSEIKASLTAEIVKDQSDTIAFSNKYETSGSVQLKATKALKGWTLSADQFNFKAKEVDKDGNPVNGGTSLTATNDKDGNISFDKINYSKAGTYYYQISEVKGSAAGYTYDGNVKTVKVVVTDNGDGTLEAAATYPTDMQFNNSYNAAGTTIQLKATKALKGWTLSAGQFTYKAKEVDKDGSTVTGGASLTATNDKDGNISFSKINYSKAGTYYYQISEAKGSAAGYTYDGDVKTVKVVVTDSGSGELAATATYPEDMQFNNSYKASEATTNLHVMKVLTGKTLEAGMFNFSAIEVKDALGSEAVDGATAMTATNDKDGNVKFADMTFNESGTHYYKITETNGSLGGITYDGKTIIAKVVVQDNGSGKLTTFTTYTSVEFDNGYSAAETNITLEGTKTLTGRDMAAGEFNFSVTENDKEVATGTNKAADAGKAAAIDFTKINYTKAGDHTYTVKETSTDGRGVKVDTKTFTVNVSVTDNGEGQLIAKASYPTTVEFNNSYNAEGTSIQLKATKALKGWTLSDDQFNFKAKEVDKDGNSVNGGTSLTANNDKDGNISFDKINYSKAGTYYYQISEVKGSAAGYTYDGDVKTVKVVVTDNEKGQLEAEATYPEDMQFNNSYSAAETTIQLKATKALEGWALSDGQFTFKAKEVDKDGSTVDGGTSLTATNDKDGNISFDKIGYSKAGTYYYQISEAKGSAAGYTYDGKVKTVKVVVTDSGSGQLTAEATYPEDMQFNNSYKASKATTNLQVKKVLTGKTLEAGMFSFSAIEVKDALGSEAVDGATAMTATNDKDGNVKFADMTFNEAGTHYYKITEKNDSLGGITYDGKAIIAKVEVQDNGSGQLTTIVTYPEDMQFNNGYSAAETNITLEGTKTLTGRDMAAGEFNFSVTENDKEVATGTNVAADAGKAAAIDFTKINYTEAGNHTYTVKETSTDGSGVKVDTKTFTVNVSVTDNGEGQLVAKATYPTNVEFNNSYTAAGTNITLEGTKTLTGRDMAAGEFNFSVIENGKEVATGTNKAAYAGKAAVIDFTKINYTEVGNHTYTVKETNTDGSGVKVDTKTFTVNVSVTDNGEGQLVAKASYPTDVEFNNSYTAKGISIQLKATKALKGWTLGDKQFTFKAKEVDKDGQAVDGGTSLTATNDKDGNISFDEINYSKAGTYYYQISEEKGSAAGYTYDGDVKTVKVVVTDNEKGQLVAKASYPEDMQFNNSYKASEATTNLQVKKVLTGKDLEAEMFNFSAIEVKDALGSETVDGATAMTATNDKDGNVKFADMTFNEAGTHYYKITEKNDSRGGITYDGKTIIATVVVQDNGSGKLTTSTTYTSVEFDNSYTAAETNIKLEGTKTLTGRDMAAGEFNFSVTENGKEVATGTNEAADAGKAAAIDFTKINYTGVGEHSYTVKETSTDGNSVKADTSTFTVKVNVTDNGEGKLVAEATYPEAVAFNNVYQTTNVKATKVWNDEDNINQLRPGSITVNLLKNGETVESKTLSKDNNWTYTWEGLQKYNNDGSAINYTVTENQVTNYNTDIAGGNGDNGSEYTITNTLKNEAKPVSKTVTKVWNDNNNKSGDRPDSIKVQLYADGTAKGDPVTLDAANGWKYTWNTLARVSEGKEINYTVKEVTELSKYVTTYSEDTFTITNSLKSSGSGGNNGYNNNSGKPDNNNSNKPNTGDDTQLWAQLSILGLALTGLGGSIYTLRRRQED